jgi:hypothetical protein
MGAQVSRPWTGVVDTKWTPRRWRRAGVLRKNYVRRYAAAFSNWHS